MKEKSFVFGSLIAAMSLLITSSVQSQSAQSKSVPVVMSLAAAGRAESIQDISSVTRPADSRRNAQGTELTTAGIGDTSSPGEGRRVTSSGWFQGTWVDRFSGPGGVTAGYSLVDDQGNWTPISLDEILTRSSDWPMAFDGKRVVVVGDLVTVPQKMILARSVQLEGLEDAEAAGLGATPLDVSGSQPWVTILCRFADFADITPHDVSWFETLLGNEYPGVDHYWREVSYDNINLTGSMVVGWYNLPDPMAAYLPPDNPSNSASLDKLANDCTAVADADVYFPDFVGINLMFNTNFSDCCTWGDTRTLTRDGQTKQYAITWFQTSGPGCWPDWGPSCPTPASYEHQWSVPGEMAAGGWGLRHSSGPYDQLYDSNWALTSGSGICSPLHPEYGCIAVHMIAYNKDRLGWIAPDRKYVASPGSAATIALERLALPQTTDYLMAQIPIGGSPTYFYTVEARRFAGYDSQIPGAAIIIHEVDTTRFDRQAQVVDVDGNGDPNDAGAMWTPGETFIDATYGITVSVDADTGSGYLVTISVDSFSPFVDCESQTQVPVAECEALVAIYNDTSGASWSEQWGWLSNPWPCLWYGITCSEGRVTEIRLSGNQLSGSISPELSSLLDLQKLDLSDNQLTGSLPASLLGMTDLQELNLGNNQLVGNIPPELGSLGNLSELILWNNQLSGSIPAELGNLTNLQALLLNNNQLSGNIPPELGNLVNLLDLGLGGNQLSGSIPPELGNLVSLIGLYLGSNQLNGSIPPALGNLSSFFRYLHLDNNQLSGSVPPELGNLTRLLQFLLHNNPLGGNLPLELISLALDSFWFNNTSLCEPNDTAFQAWLADIPDLSGTGVICGIEYEYVYLPLILR